MKIIVPIKQVPDVSSVRIDEETGTVIREGADSIVNPLDLHAIEAALRIKESHGAHVTAISMGPLKALEAVKEAVSMGVDSGVLLSDKAFAGSDTWATSMVLARAIEKIGSCDLIICGEKATDGDTGQVGPGVAAFLDLPVVTYVSRIEEINESSCEVKRLIENGYEIVKCQLPAVITVVKDIAVPRLPTLAGKMRAMRLDVPVWDADQLDIDKSTVGLKGSPTRVVKISKPSLSRNCKQVLATDANSIKSSVGMVVDLITSRETIR